MEYSNDHDRYNRYAFKTPNPPNYQIGGSGYSKNGRNPYELDEKFEYFIDIMADDFCEMDESGNYVIKPEARSQLNLHDDALFVHHNNRLQNQRIAGSPNQILSSSPTGENEDYNDQSENANNRLGRWTEQEHQLFMEALLIYGKDWDLI